MQVQHGRVPYTRFTPGFAESNPACSPMHSERSCSAVSDPGFPISFSMKTPPGEDRERRVCNACGFVDYINPRIVAGVIACRNGKILLCRRAIEPRRGFWTLPAGFMELGAKRVRKPAPSSKSKRCWASIRFPELGRSRYSFVRGSKMTRRRVRKAWRSGCSSGKIFRGLSLPSRP